MITERDASGKFAKQRTRAKHISDVNEQTSGPVRMSLDVLKHRGTYNSFGYESSISGVRDGRVSPRGSGAFHQGFDRGRLLNESRDFYRNNAIYRGMISRAATYVVSKGWSLQAMTGNKSRDRKLEAIWKKFWKRPDVRGVLPGRRVERMVATELLQCGDTGIIRTNKNKIQLIEAEQITSKGHRDGIETDMLGMPTGYWVSPYRQGRSGALGSQADEGSARRFKPEEFMFVTDPERPSAIRGVPPAQASFPMLHRINDVLDSEAIAWQLLARMGIAINRVGGSQLAIPESTDDTSKSATDRDGDMTTRVTDIDYATIFHGEPGEEVKGIDRNIPGSDFPSSIRMFLRLMGLPLGLPLEIVLLDWTESNYSQSRAVLEQAYMMFLDWQFLLEETFYIPTYEWAIALAIENREITGDLEKLTVHQWAKPTFPWIDQLKEAQAHALRTERGFASHTDVLRSQGTDRDKFLIRREQEFRDAIEISQRIFKDTGVLVGYQHLCGLRPPGERGRPQGTGGEGVDVGDGGDMNDGDDGA